MLIIQLINVSMYSEYLISNASCRWNSGHQKWTNQCPLIVCIIILLKYNTLSRRDIFPFIISYVSNNSVTAHILHIILFSAHTPQLYMTHYISLA